jgi:hypothetical protein
MNAVTRAEEYKVLTEDHLVSIFRLCLISFRLQHQSFDPLVARLQLLGKFRQLLGVLFFALSSLLGLFLGRLLEEFLEGGMLSF